MSNVYVRDKNSIKSITLTRILFLLPLLIYGFYKHGIHLYKNKYIDIYHLFKPLIIIIIAILIGILVNVTYEKIIRKNKSKLNDIIFSSFHIEYAILLGAIISINTNLLIFSSVTLIMLFISKFFKDRINITALSAILIITISSLIKSYSFLNIYEASKIFQLNFMDYMIGKNPGGIATTHIFLIIIAIIGLHITNNNKTSITISSIISYATLAIMYMTIKKNYSLDILFLTNTIFAFTFIATDSPTSSCTNKGQIAFGIITGILTFVFFLIIPSIAPFIAISITSLLNNLIDRKANILKIHPKTDIIN